MNNMNNLSKPSNRHSDLPSKILLQLNQQRRICEQRMTWLHPKHSAERACVHSGHKSRHRRLQRNHTPNLRFQK